MKNLFGNLNFGVNHDVRLSHLGIAIKNVGGEYVSYDKEKNEIVNVDCLNFDNSNMVYNMPIAIKDVKIGDVLIHNHDKVYVFVESINEDGTITVVDIFRGEKKNILPSRSIFGFNFVTKVTSLIDFSNIGASSDSPFGNFLPLMLMNEGENRNLAMMMMMMGKDQDWMKNPMLMMMLLDNERGSNDILPFLMMSQMS